MLDYKVKSIERRSANDEVISIMRFDDMPPNEGEGALH